MSESESTEQQLMQLTRQLLDSISQCDWETYTQLCDPTLTCFEPETRGQLVEGMRFHRFYFDHGGHLGGHQSTITSPHVRLLSEDAAVVSYVRLVQRLDENTQPQTDCYEETRIWHRRDGRWRHVHFHRSACR